MHVSPTGGHVDRQHADLARNSKRLDSAVVNKDPPTVDRHTRDGDIDEYGPPQVRDLHPPTALVHAYSSSATLAVPSRAARWLLIGWFTRGPRDTWRPRNSREWLGRMMQVPPLMRPLS
jgi:hypothetical protein